MPNRLIALEGPLQGRVFPLPHVTTTLGDDPFSHISWSDPALEPEHAHIRWNGQHFELFDLSEKGTYLNGEPVEDSVVLEPRDKIRIGQGIFLFATGSDAPPPGSATSSEPTRRRKQPAGHSEPLARNLRLMAGVLIIAIIILVIFALFVMPGIWGLLLPVATETPTATASPSPSRTLITPTTTSQAAVTATPVPESRYYPVPLLLAPQDGTVGTEFTLQWSWQGALDVDEWYSVWVWREGEAPKSLAWTKDLYYHVGQSLGSGVFRWQVIVVQGLTQGNWQRDLSAPSETRRFTLLAFTATPTWTPTFTYTATPTPTSTPTATHTPEPVSRVIITGQVYNAQQGLFSPLPNAQVRVYLGPYRQAVQANSAGRYRVEFQLTGQDTAVPVDVLVAAPGYEPGIGNALLDRYAPGMTQQVTLDVGLHPSPTVTPTWLPPTATPTPIPPTATATATLLPPTWTSTPMPVTVVPAP